MFRTQKNDVVLCHMETFLLQTYPGPSKNRKLELGFEEEMRFLFGEGKGKHFYEVYRACGRAQKCEMAHANWRMQNRD